MQAMDAQLLPMINHVPYAPLPSLDEQDAPTPQENLRKKERMHIGKTSMSYGRRRM